MLFVSFIKPGFTSLFRENPFLGNPFAYRVLEKNILSSTSPTREILANVVTRRCHTLDYLHWNLFLSFDTEHMPDTQPHSAHASFLH